MLRSHLWINSLGLHIHIINHSYKISSAVGADMEVSSQIGVDLRLIGFGALINQTISVSTFDMSVGQLGEFSIFYFHF